MKRQILNRLFWSVLVCATAAVLLALGTHAIAEDSVTKAPDTKPATSAYNSVDGVCSFMGRGGTWSAKITPSEDGTYKASYIAAYSGNNRMIYEGSIKSDWKGEVSGNGKSISGGGNGSFEFSGKFDESGVAKCNYKEIGGTMARTGTLTVNQPKKIEEATPATTAK
jgi:hypothetical protein